MIGLASRSTSQPAQPQQVSGSSDSNDTINSSKRKTIISSVKKRFEDKYGLEASPTIDKYLQELNKKDKVTPNVSYIQISLPFCAISALNSHLLSLLIRWFNNYESPCRTSTTSKNKSSRAFSNTMCHKRLKSIWTRKKNCYWHDLRITQYWVTLMSIIAWTESRTWLWSKASKPKKIRIIFSLRLSTRRSQASDNLTKTLAHLAAS